MLPIHHTFGPLADRRQRLLALRLSYAPWRYVRGPSIDRFEQTLSRALGGTAITFSSGREGLLALLQSIDHADGDEILVQGYTCVALPNAIHAARFTPVYCDIEKDTLNLDIADIKHHITPKTRAIICQNTFGIPADAESLRALCDKHGILLIEDCAHVLPDATGPREIGKHGHFMMLSFGRDKAISGVAGGAIVSRVDAVSERIQKLQADADDVSWRTVATYLEYPAIYAIGRALYGSGIGKFFLWLCAKLGLLVPILSTQEKHGTMPLTLHRMPNACAALALDQWQRLQAINDHRRLLTRFYLQQCKNRGWKVLDGITEDLPLQKFPMFVHNPDRMRRELKRHNMHLDDGWTGCVVCPRSVIIEKTGYTSHADPCAEDVAEGILSLPTHPGIRQADAERLMEHLAPLLRQ